MKFILIIVLAVLALFVMFCYRQYMNMIRLRYPKKPIDPELVPADEKEFVAQSYNGLQAVADAEIEALEVTSEDGLKLKGKLFRLNPGTNKVVIGFHGYHADGYRDMGRFCRLYRELGCDYLIITQRNHDDSEGKYICFGYKERYDALKWIEKIINIYGPEVEIALHGISMGAATVMMTSALPQLPGQVKGIVEDCGYSSMYEESVYVLSQNLPHWVAVTAMEMMCLIGKVLAGCTVKQASPKDYISNSRIPALMIHGKDDHYVPYYMLKENANVYGGPHETFSVEKAGHAESYLYDQKGYDERVRKFIKGIFNYGENR